MAAPLINKPATIRPASAFRFICMLNLPFVSDSSGRVHCVLFIKPDHMNLNTSLSDKLQYAYVIS
jgi:hypothetical protein